MSQLRIVFMGTPDFAVPTLEALVAGPYQVVGAYCQPDKPKGRGKQLQAPPVKVCAEGHGIPVYQPVTLKDEDVKAQLEALAPDLIVVVAYGKILPPWLIRLPKYGCLNVHASILPKYRGAAPIHYAIMNNDAETGVTIMHMDDGLDTGDMIEVTKVAIEPKETTGQLFERLALLGGQVINDVIDRWTSGQITAQPQDHALATHCGKVTKEMGHMDWSRDAHSLSGLIRGLNPAPGCYTFIGGKRLKVWMAEALEEKSQEAPGTIVA
ncbi:MAG: methionyl-tRNA formyltransferase, partial [Veillonella sp.]|nr:methionyl-tRNA formyltransferase [Veillonella sp.]